MDVNKLQENMIYLINKYVPERDDLRKLIVKEADSVKFILAEIDRFKKEDYIKEDIDLIKDIVYFYI